jgi:thioredoxin-dependent peroxiredoxin
MAQERTGIVTFKGNPMTLVGPALKPGDHAPDFQALGAGLVPVNLASTKGKVRLFSVVPSLDTPVCSIQTKKFNVEVAKLPANVQPYTVSCDLPFAQARFCGAEGVGGRMATISDHRDVSFGTAYGVLIKELRLLTRSIVVVDAKDRVAYVQIVPEITSEPNYAEALEAAKKAAG